ncbi:MAG: alpha/beta hydrolase [Candidatus Shapirobacteria bacterium]
MKINLFVIHGYNGDTLETFGPYVEKEAKRRGLEVILPSFPAKELVTYASWSDVLEKYRSEIDKNTIIVAHSLGTHFIPRYLADKNLTVGLYISMAGFLNDHSGRLDLEKVVKEFKPNEEQINKAIKLMGNRYSIYSNDDHLNPQEELEKYAERFNSNKVFIPNIGHMGRKSGIKEIPQIMKIIDDYLTSSRESM